MIVKGVKKQLAEGAAWLAATRLVINLAGFANTLLLARLLVPADFGLVALATTLTTIVSSITELSLASALVHHSNPDEDHFHTAWTLNLARSCLISIAILALAFPVARMYGDLRLAPIMVVIGAMTFLSGNVNPKMVIFSRDLVFWQEFAVGTSQKIAGLVVAAAIALAYRSYWALVAGIVANQTTILVVSYILKPYRPRFKLTRVRDLLSFSIWLSLAQVVNTLNYKFDQLVIGYFLGNTVLGYYTVGDNLAVLPTREATTPLAQTLFPGFVRLTGEPARLRAAYQRAQAFLCAVALPVGFIFALVTQPLLQLTMSAKWQPAVVVIQFLSCIFALQTLSSSLQPLAMALGRTRQLFGRDVLNLVLRLPLIVVGLDLYGMLGIVYARCVSGILSTIINMEMVRGMLQLTIYAQLAANVRSLLSVGVMMIIMSFIESSLSETANSAILAGRIACLVAAGGTAYCGLLYAMWRAAGSPVGPESEVMHLLGRLLTQIRRSLHRPIRNV